MTTPRYTGTELHEFLATNYPIGLEMEELKMRMRKLEGETGSGKVPQNLANPTVLGLAGFGTTTFLLQFHNFGVISIAPVVWVGLMFGGLAQLIAGLQLFNRGDSFGYCAFSTYGSFWLSFCSLVIGKSTNLLKFSDMDLGLFMLAFTLVTLIFLVVSARHNCAIFFVFLTLFIGFILLVVALCAEQPNCQTAAASVLLICSFSAWYIMTHLLLKDVSDQDILPVGPPPTNLLAKWFGLENKTGLISPLTAIQVR